MILLNKIDLSKAPKKDTENCKSLIINIFPKCQTLNLNLNTFIALSLEQVQNELLMNKSFAHFIYYLFYNYIFKIKETINPSSNSQSFIGHLQLFIEKSLKININDIKSKVDELNQSKNISEVNKEIISIIEYLQKKFLGKGINFGFNINDLYNDEDEENLLDNKEDENNSDDIPISFIFKLLYIYYKEKVIIPSISNETMNLLNYFQTKRKRKKLPTNYNYVEKSIQLEKKLNSLEYKLKKSKIDINKIQSLFDEITDTLKFVKHSEQIFIPILGLSNAGKTTILNGIIGRNILPTDLKECTKRGIIIRYEDLEDEEISIYKSNFIEGKYLDKPHYFFNEGYIIGKGIKQVNDLLKGLNYKFTEIEEDCFYYIKTKIKLFDELDISDSLKRKIYLIDFPGYGTDNKFMEKQICKKIVGNSSSFIFLVKNGIIIENQIKQIIDYIFNQNKNQNIYSETIKSCSFILNIDNSLTSKEINLEQAKKDIKKNIENKIDFNNINICFFNG